jgi:hypothetical protein
MHKPTETKAHPFGGTIKIYNFSNGYGASVVNNSHSYGGEEGLWELAVRQGDAINYDTPITDDVLGWLSDQDVENTLDQIQAL